MNKPSKAQRQVLEKMAKGKHVTFYFSLANLGGSAYFNDGYPVVSKATFYALRNRCWITSTNESDRESYWLISDAGRKAITE